MFPSLPNDHREFLGWGWTDLEPYYRELQARPLDEGSLPGWLADWSELSRILDEIYRRLYVGTTVDTTDAKAKRRYATFLDETYPPARAAAQKLKEKLLASGYEPAGMEVPLRNMRAEASLFRAENLPLLSDELKLASEYSEITGTQTVTWEGREVTVVQLQTVYLEAERERRERAWRLAAERQLADREAIGELWGRLMQVRGRQAENASLPDYRAYRWQYLLRFDYSPQDCARFHQAILEVVVPAAEQLYEKRRRRLGVETLRPWDLDVDPLGRPPLHPFRHVEELESNTARIFQRVDPQLGEYFEIMRREGLLDLENRKGKAIGGYCIEFQASRRPFIFTNAIGVHDDVQTLLHEGGHAFHVFEESRLPYQQQLTVPWEFMEVASMGMELLASPYLPAEEGGFYSRADAVRAHLEHLERSLLFWPYMAVVDAFQHWVYENHAAASIPANCDAKWTELWDRFMRGIDWSGLEQEKATGWQRKLHIHEEPFYYVEYGLAQLGAFQVWRNALRDQAGAVTAYRRALALGGTATLPELFRAAGARFAFDAGTLSEVVELILGRISALEAA